MSEIVKGFSERGQQSQRHGVVHSLGIGAHGGEIEDVVQIPGNEIIIIRLPKKNLYHQVEDISVWMEFC